MRAIWGASLVAALALRAAPISGARPYFHYVDEGNFLHSSLGLLERGGWDSGQYLYPQLPTTIAVGAMRSYARIHDAFVERPLRDLLPERVEVYDDFEPFSLLLIGRFLSLVLGMLIVAGTGLLASRLGGPAAGAAAVTVAAFLPALVLRGPNAAVDPFAAFFVLVSLWLTDRTRDGVRPGWLAFGAGAAAGLAFASKYPAVLAFAAFVTTTVLLAVPLSEKRRRLGLGMAGLIAGAAAGMPALLSHGRAVLEAIGEQASVYGRMPSPSLAHQAFVEAEWDLRFGHAELGVAVVAFALGGLVLGLRDRRIAPTVWGWCAFGALSLGLFSRQAFQPFRNLLPLTPIVCVAASLAFVRLRARMRRPFLADFAAAAWILAAFGLPVAAHARERAALRDSRVLAIDWLVSHSRPADEVLVARELGLLRQELSRLPAKTTVRRTREMREALERTSPRFVVPVSLSDLDAAIRSGYSIRFEAGQRPTPPTDAWWRDNDERIVVLERN